VALNTIQPDLVRFEMRVVQGVDPHVREQKRPGAFGRFLSGLGKILGSVAMPLSFIFPPAAIGAAGMYGVGAIGDQMQARAYGRAMEKMQREQATNVVFPGLEPGGTGIRPAAFDHSVRDQQVMDVLDARGGAMSGMAREI
jgi:hypothetical protein